MCKWWLSHHDKDITKSPHTLDPAANVIMTAFKAAVSALQRMTEVEKVEREKHAEQKANNLEVC